MNREKVINGLRCCVCQDTSACQRCGYIEDGCLENIVNFKSAILRDALELLEAQEPVDYIPIDWLMNYAQLPTEFAISAWRKPKKEAEIKHAKSLDKPMSLDDALELLKAQEPRVMTPTEIAALKENDIVWYEQHGTDGDFIAAMVADGREFIGNASIGVKLKYLDGSERLWTSRPTDEQREATPWGIT